MDLGVSPVPGGLNWIAEFVGAQWISVQPRADTPESQLCAPWAQDQYGVPPQWCSTATVSGKKIILPCSVFLLTGLQPQGCEQSQDLFQQSECTFHVI